MTWVDEIAQWVKVFAVKSDSLSSILQAMYWKKLHVVCRKLSSDSHPRAVADTTLIHEINI